MKVEELSQYGKTLSGLPKEAIKKQKSIVFREIKKKFGLLGLVPFMIKMSLEQKQLKNKYPHVYEDSKNKFNKDTANEIVMLVAMYQIIGRKEGGEKVQCELCKACGGWSSKTPKSVAIMLHADGPELGNWRLDRFMRVMKLRKGKKAGRRDYESERKQFRKICKF